MTRITTTLLLCTTNANNLKRITSGGKICGNSASTSWRPLVHSRIFDWCRYSLQWVISLITLIPAKLVCVSREIILIHKNGETKGTFLILNCHAYCISKEITKKKSVPVFVLLPLKPLGRWRSYLFPWANKLPNRLAIFCETSY